MGTSNKTATNADVDVAVFIGLDPRLRLHVVLADHGTGVHRGMNLITGAVKKARVDEGDSRLRGPNAFEEVDGGPSFFVHNPDLDGVLGQTEELLYAREQLDGERRFFRPMHFRFDDVYRAGPGVPNFNSRFICAHKIMQRTQRGDHSVDKSFWHLIAVSIENHGRCHEMSNVAGEEQRATRPLRRRSVGCHVLPIVVQRTHERGATFGDRLGQCTLHQPEPIAVREHFVVHIDCGN